MARFVFGMSQSLDGYVDHLELPGPGPELFQHFLAWVGDLTGNSGGDNPKKIGSGPGLGCSCTTWDITFR